VTRKFSSPNSSVAKKRRSHPQHIVHFYETTEWCAVSQYSSLKKKCFGTESPAKAESIWHIHISFSRQNKKTYQKYQRDLVSSNF
jgi:hypothetical protein